MNYQKIDDILTSWGKGFQQQPPNDQILKSEILAQISLAPIKIASIRPWVLWLSWSLAAVATVLFFVNSVSLPISNVTSPQPFSLTKSSTEGAALPQADERNQTIIPSGTVPIIDNREFLKKDYSATLRSRDVPGLVDQVQITVRGFNGRVDGSGSSDKTGFISFVIPVNSLDTFRAQIKSLVASKFYLEQVYTQNLLPQKQSIEQSRSDAEKALGQLQDSRQQLISSHSSTVHSLELRLQAVVKEQSSLQAEVTQDPVRQAEINARLEQLAKQKLSLQSQLSQENSRYEQQLSSLDSQISYTQTNLENIQKQDQNLTDNVATIQGYIVINWISLWDAADLYLPGPLVAWLFLIAASALYLWQRKYYGIWVP